jgi:alkanesulfonate monooxygenase SsuD/methylene tetrahydromethanopterin reductase-like flavin-dependent oxidoreductase (luciferase family)
LAEGKCKQLQKMVRDKSVSGGLRPILIGGAKGFSLRFKARETGFFATGWNGRSDVEARMRLWTFGRCRKHSRGFAT